MSWSPGWMKTRSDRKQAAEKVHLRRSRSSEILTYDPVRSGFLLPAALHLELFEQPVKNPNGP
jgi:hypothetical protein